MTVPIGTILAYAGDVDGDARGRLQSQGWLVCDGQEYAQLDYPDLEITIGTYYGTASKAGMFKVPDLRGLFLRGVDNGKGRDPDANSRIASADGGNTRDKVGSYQDDGFKTHQHVHLIDGAYQTTPGGSASDPIALAGYPSPTTYRKTVYTEYTGIQETRPKNIYVNYIIKAKNV